MKRLHPLMFATVLLNCGGTVESDSPGTGADAAGTGGTDAGAEAEASGGSGGSTGGSGGSTGGSGGSTGGAGGGSGGSGGTVGPVESCPELEGPAMVLLPEGYCIDSTEVTRAHYRAWLDTDPSTEGQVERCEWNDTFEPADHCEIDYFVNGKACAPPGCPDAPQGCVDWCDAHAYCKAVGKRMCGKIGGGKLSLNQFDDPTKSQWHNACTSGGAYVYPYGNQPVEDACNDDDPQWQGLHAAGSTTTCQSPDPEYAGVFDLSGNMFEWEDICEYYTGSPSTGNPYGSSDSCRIRGGAWGLTAEEIPCDRDDVGNRNWDTCGIRCCYP